MDNLIDKMFRMNGKVYTVWSEYGYDTFGDQVIYQCRRLGGGTIYLPRVDIEPHIIQSMGV